MKNIAIFHLKIIFFTAVKYHSILHGQVCVMGSEYNGYKVGRFGAQCFRNFLRLNWFALLLVDKFLVQVSLTVTTRFENQTIPVVWTLQRCRFKTKSIPLLIWVKRQNFHFK